MDNPFVVNKVYFSIGRAVQPEQEVVISSWLYMGTRTVSKTKEIHYIFAEWNSWIRSQPQKESELCLNRFLNLESATDNMIPEEKLKDALALNEVKNFK